MGGEPGDPTGGDLIERELEAHRAREEMERVKREQAQRAREAADTAAQDAVSRAREMIRTFLATVAPLGPATLEAVDVVERDSTQRNGIRHDFTRRVGRAHGWLIAAGRERHPVYKIEGSYYILLRQDGGLYRVLGQLSDGIVWGRPSGRPLMIQAGAQPMGDDFLARDAFDGPEQDGSLPIDQALARGMAAILDRHGLAWPKGPVARGAPLPPPAMRDMVAPITPRELRSYLHTAVTAFLGLAPLFALSWPSHSPGAVALPLIVVLAIAVRAYDAEYKIVASLIIGAAGAGIGAALNSHLPIGLWLWLVPALVSAGTILQQRSRAMLFRTLPEWLPWTLGLAGAVGWIATWTA